jgi:hypothetical protein
VPIDPKHENRWQRLRAIPHAGAQIISSNFFRGSGFMHRTLDWQDTRA